MGGLRMLLWTMLLLPLLTLVPPANAQITVIVGGPPPVCMATILIRHTHTRPMDTTDQDIFITTYF